MLTKETIDYIVEHIKVKRSFDDFMNYGFLIGPLAFVLIGYAMLRAYFSYPDHDHAGLVFSAIVIISLGLLGFYYGLKRLNGNISFTFIPVTKVIAIDDFCQTLELVFKKVRIDPNKDLRTIVLITRTR